MAAAVQAATAAFESALAASTREAVTIAETWRVKASNVIRPGK
ncbi:MAG TPA: hypothetical protein VKT29_11010 [Terriglobales bacterium]|nr:hypothetical protein [Terriglobales bacterium]